MGTVQASTRVLRAGSGRARVLLVCVLAIAAISLLFASPALAATTWPTITPNPGDTVGTTNIVEAEAVDDSYAIVSATLTINGVTRAPLFITGLITQDVYISFDPAQDGLLTPGANHAVATVTNSHGDVSSQPWDFTVNAPPTIAASSPANDALVTNTTSPAVSVTLSDPDDSTFTGQFSSGRTFTVDGGSVASSYSAATKTYSFTRSYSPLVWHTIVFSVKDSAGNPATRTWRFMVDTSPDTINPTLTDPNPIPGSTTNPKPTFTITAGDNRPGNLSVGFTLDGAPVYSTVVSLPTANATQLVTWTPASNLSLGAHTVSADATDAAGNKAVRQTWSFTVADTLVATHTTSTGFTTCSACHSPVLTTEHANRGLDCNTCHSASASQRVQDAITAKNTACDACHDVGASGHEALHDGGFAAGANCGNCHNQNIALQHQDNCPTCHQSSDPLVVAAIAAHNPTCSACHPGSHAVTGGINHSGTQRLGMSAVAGAPVGGVGTNPANNVAGVGTYTYMDWSTGLGTNGVVGNSPHGNYTTTTVKCAVCHAVHNAAAGGAPVGSGQTADTLLRMKASDACGFCHGQTGTAVNGTPVYDGIYTASMLSGGSQNTGHAVGTNCNECHASVHGVGEDDSVASLAGYLLKKQTNGPSTDIYSSMSAIETTAVAQGFAAGAALGATPATYQSTNTSTLREQAVGVFCAECHNGAYATVAAGAQTNVAGAGTAAFSGHRIAAAATTNWNGPGNQVSSSALTGVAVAWAPATDCKSCHDATDSFGATAFPHSWGGTKMWLMSASNAGAAKTTLSYGTAAGSGYNPTSASAPQLTDGVCLKCHVAGGGAAGVGVTF